MAEKMIRTKYPGIYRRGSRYVITWTHRGRQHKEAFRTLTDAREAKARRHTTDRRPYTNALFEDYAEKWLDTYRGRKPKLKPISESTRKLYRHSITKVAIPYFRGWRLRDIAPEDVEAFVREMEKAGLGYSNMRGHLVALKVLFATACVRDRLIPSNPAQEIRLETTPPDERVKAMTEEELGLVLAALPKKYQPFFRLLAMTGLRISEAIGLRWEDVELGTDRPHIKVRRQLYRGQERQLKSRNSVRSLPLSPGMVATLLALRAKRYRGPEAPVWATRRGTPLDAHNVRRRVLRPTVEALGLPWVGFHSFRHTCASILFARGRDVKQVQVWLGHSNPGFTLRTYIHLMDDGLGDPAFLDEAVAVPHPAQNDRSTVS